MKVKAFGRVRSGTKWSDRVQDWYSQLKAIHSLRDARLYLGLSFRELGIEIARVEKRSEPYRKSTVASWCKAANRKYHAPMTEAQVRAAGKLLATKAAQLSQRDRLGLKLSHNSPWRVQVWERCWCGAWYEVKRKTWRRCKACRSKQEMTGC